jgi:3-phosphoshikimate 1-carboxyvinyltransferase
MADALRILGTGIHAAEREPFWMITGNEARFPVPAADLAVGNAGTAMRFLTAALCLGHGTYRIDGNARMRERPIQDLIDGLRQLGCRVAAELGNGCPPLRIEAAGIPGGECRVPGTHSSQFFSAILLAAPYARNDVTITVEGKLVSAPYVAMTVRMMRDFGARVEHDGSRWFRVAAGYGYRGRDYLVEPDASNASYYFAAAAIGGGPVRVRGLSRESVQGDVRFLDVLQAMGCRVSCGPDGIEVSGGPLRGGTFDLSDMPDVAQTLAVVALFAQGPTTIRNVGNLRIKETDRLHALSAELRRLGAEVHEGPDSLTLVPGPLRGAAIQTYDDHRMAMSFALAGTRIPGVTILDPQCVSKTYPDYFEEMRRIGLKSRPAPG